MNKVSNYKVLNVFIAETKRINKFKIKYGDKPSITKLIDNEVAKYLNNDRLTEESLRNLDSKIMKEVTLRNK